MTLEETKGQWEKTFDAVPDLILILDSEHRIVQANKAAADLLGIPLEQIVGQRCYQLIHGREAPIPTCPHSLLLADGEEHTAEVVEERVGKVFQFSVSPLRGPGGQLLGSVHVARDITARTRAERALRGSEERYRLLVDHANDLVYRTDASGILTFINPAASRITGYSQKELVGRHYLEFIHPDNREEIERFYGIQFVKSIQNTYHEYRLLTRGGETVWIGQNVQLLTDADSVVGFQAIARDITDLRKAEDALRMARDELKEQVLARTSELVKTNEQLRESEARFRAIFQTAEDCVFVQDLEFRYTHVNPSMERLLDRVASELIGHTDEAVFGEVEGRYTREVGSRVLLGQSVEEERTRLIGGLPTTFHEIRVPLRDSSGSVIGLCGISRDVTERRMLRTPAQPLEAELYPSAAMHRTLEKARMAGKTEGIVLLTGESGCGKDYLARYIHDHSARANGPFFAINCAAVPLELAESELFGHERGAFSGAVRRKRGLLELAEGGTLLLNEIGELPLVLQAKILSFLDTRLFTRVGGVESISVNARLIAATNRALEEEIDAGRFRKDLFFRLNVLSIVVPPLRERRDDIPVLAEEILAALARDMQLDHIPILPSSAVRALAKYRWPGNVRELRNVLERSLMLSRGHNVRVDLPGAESHVESDWRWVATFPPAHPLNDVASDLKRSLIMEALKQSKGKKTGAARLLKITRDALKRQMQTLGLD